MNTALEYEVAGISTLTGAPREVRERMEGLDAEQVVVLAFNHTNPRETEAISETMANVVHIVRSVVEKQSRESLEKIVEALVPKAPPLPNELKEAAMLARARTAVIESGDWLTAAQLAEMAQFSSSNPSAQPNKWKRDGAIFAIRHNGIDYFPSYALDPHTGYRPRKAMSEIIKTFGAAKDGWGLAYWFMSDNSFLGGKRPKDLLATQAGQVLAAARDELEGSLHG